MELHSKKLSQRGSYCAQKVSNSTFALALEEKTRNTNLDVLCLASFYVSLKGIKPTENDIGQNIQILLVFFCPPPKLGMHMFALLSHRPSALCTFGCVNADDP